MAQEERPKEIIINSCEIGGMQMGGANAIKMAYERKYNQNLKDGEEKVKVTAQRSAPYFFYIDVTKKYDENEKNDVKQGGCCGFAFWKMFMMVTCCCNTNQADAFAEEY